MRLLFFHNVLCVKQFFGDTFGKIWDPQTVRPWLRPCLPRQFLQSYRLQFLCNYAGLLNSKFQTHRIGLPRALMDRPTMI
jgi:hypothetical protein